MRYRIYLDELDEKSTELVNYSKNNIASKINELAIVFNDINWHGKASNAFINGYNNKINNLKRLNNNIELLARFLRECHDNYSETNNTLGKSWDSFIDEVYGGHNEL